jgi:hypothetical protein
MSAVNPGFLEDVLHLKVEDGLIGVDAAVHPVRLHQLFEINGWHETLLAQGRRNLSKAAAQVLQPFMLFLLP